MLFNSLHFVIFFPLFLCAYFLVPRKDQYKVMLLGGYYFYGSFNWYLLLILFGITCNDFFAGKMIEKTTEPHKRKRWLMLSIAGNLGVLIVCKYLNFIDDNLREIFAFFHINWPIAEAAMNDWIVPVGVSFITFQSLSYTIDVYKGLIRAEKSFGHFCAFTAFWPVMVNGPIERGKNLLPQIHQEHAFDVFRLKEGLLRMAWGMFKKVVIADRLAFYVDDFYAHYNDVSGWTIWIGGFLFLLQVYCDFSGYSDIAIGTAKLFGIDLFRNFAFPYFSKNIAEFWKRWHISLTSWFKDYLYIPLGGSQAGFRKQVRNIFIVFIVSGFWHGANWTFIVWGLLHALFFLILLLVGKSRVKLDISTRGRIIPSGKDFIAMACTFSLTVFAWIFFRAENLNHAFQYVTGIFIWNHDPLRMMPNTLLVFDYWLTILFVVAFMVYEWFQRDKEHGLQLSPEYPVRNWCIYIVLAAGIVLFAGSQHEFIYFQF